MKRLTFLFLLAAITLCHATSALAHLHPQLQRFVQRDPAGYVDGQNLTGYEENAPTSRVDARGLCAATCCCAESVTIDRIKRSVSQGQGGHQFDVTLKMSTQNGPPGDCTFEWWEKSDIPTPQGVKWGQQQDQWFDFGGSGSDTLGPWRDRYKAGHDPLNIPITDKPRMDLGIEGDRHRYIDFRIVIKSAPNCPCAKDYADATAFQLLYVGMDGNVQWDKSGFVSPSGPITPGKP